MIRLNRVTEYALIALHHIDRKGEGARTSAREVADAYALPFEVTAKTLQRLRDLGFIESTQGARGGYAMRRSCFDISLAEFIEKLEGPTAVVPCGLVGKSWFEGTCCEYESRCEIQEIMGNLNSRVRDFLVGIRLSDILSSRGPSNLITSRRSNQVTWAPVTQYAEEP